MNTEAASSLSLIQEEKYQNPEHLYEVLLIGN